MSTFYRYDAIQLHDKAKEEDFIKLMKETIMPHFKSNYSKQTRVLVCLLGKQELLKDTKQERKYIWVNTWSGREDVISDISFSGAGMGTPLESITSNILKKINDFGKRKITNIYTSVE